MKVNEKLRFKFFQLVHENFLIPCDSKVSKANKTSVNKNYKIRWTAVRDTRVPKLKFEREIEI